MSRTVIIGIIGLVMALLALGLNNYWAPEPPDFAEDGETVVDGGTNDTAATEGASSTDTTPSTPSTDETVTEDSTQSGATADDEAMDNMAPSPPSFDVVRISKEGDTVIAGRAKPGAVVIILDGEEEIGRVEADARGEWVFLPEAPLDPGPHTLSLAMVIGDDGEGRLISDNNVVLIAPEKGKDIAGQDTEGGGEALALLVPQGTSAEGTSAPVKVLQKPSGAGVSAETGGLVVDSVEYDDEGQVAIGGRGQPGAEVQAYLDDKPVGKSEIGEDGRWAIIPDGDVSEGTYSLRVDAADKGKVISRLELPFQKAKPITDFTGDNFIIVQPGLSLWRIARRTLGTGFNYTIIYEANKDQIRDPDLIYPGQIFEVPGN